MLRLKQYIEKIWKKEDFNIFVLFSNIKTRLPRYFYIADKHYSSGSQSAPFRRLIDMIRANSLDFEADGRVLRLKQYMSADARPAMIDLVLDALAVNIRVEALYIQNFELVCPIINTGNMV